jgi:hypothetical protein
MINVTDIVITTAFPLTSLRSHIMKMAVFWLLQQVVWNKFTDISAVFTAPIIRVMT